MKKIFLFLAVAGSAFMTSCSDDDSTSTPVASSIALTSDVQTLDLGNGSFNMTVTNDLGENVTATSTFYVDDAAIASNVFTPTEAGTYVLHATNGTLVSNDVTVTVTTPATAITLTTDATTMALGSGSFTMTVMNDLGADVTASSTYYVDNVAISSNVFTPTAEGTYVLHATKGGLVSNEVTVTVTPAMPALNSIFYAGVNYAVDNSALVYYGNFNPNDPDGSQGLPATHTYWTHLVFQGAPADFATSQNVMEIDFLTPLNSDGSVALPTTTNTGTFLTIWSMKLNGVDVDVTTQSGGSIVYGANITGDASQTTAQFNLTGVTIAGSAMSLEFNSGFVGIIDGTQKNAVVANLVSGRN
jgi:hypothetical protein